MSKLTEAEIHATGEMAAHIMGASLTCRMFRTTAGIFCDFAAMVIEQEQRELSEDPDVRQHASECWAVIVKMIDDLLQLAGIEITAVEFIKRFQSGDQIELLTWMAGEADRLHPAYLAKGAAAHAAELARDEDEGEED